jgi:hypothetical protein
MNHPTLLSGSPEIYEILNRYQCGPCCSLLDEPPEGGRQDMTRTSDTPVAAVLPRSSLEPDAAPVGLRLEKFRDPLHIPPVIRVPSSWQSAQRMITMRATYVRLHSQLPPTHVWAYNGSFPVRRSMCDMIRTCGWSGKTKFTGSCSITAAEVRNGTTGSGRDGANPLPDVARFPRGQWCICMAPEPVASTTAGQRPPSCRETPAGGVAE